MPGFTPILQRMKRIRRTLLWFVLALVAAHATGCGGINTSGSVSPLMFLLNKEKETAPPPAPLVETPPAPATVQS